MQKYVHLVDLVKSFATNIDLQNLASIQPRTSLSKFGENEYMYIIESTHQFVSIRVSCAASSAASGSMAGAADGGRGGGAGGAGGPEFLKDRRPDFFEGSVHG